MRIYPLADVIADADNIFVASVKARDSTAHEVTLMRLKTLKGAAPTQPITVALSGSDNRSQMPLLEQRLVPGRQILLFGKPRRFMLGYTNGTWFRVADVPGGKRLQFVHLEVYLTRTFRGSTDSLQEAVEGVLSGAKKAPDPDPNAKPGFGPP